ncbi:hypothetical protein FNV43_RR19095 [Rhamnella rubrinervis]|uniref:Uncharacterized protein n=1 Tax=Rhamnella rubrinervis TaxID=2594499 RepID=A0A8K0E7I3_9ROSA|nr:hypothetical protein FNV43_RR19095 [Rhamnella rubrinervis]
MSGLCRAQVEQATATTAYNVNAYGQKEEGPSRWQEKREAKRQIYLISTETASRSAGSVSNLGTGHVSISMELDGHDTKVETSEKHLKKNKRKKSNFDSGSAIHLIKMRGEKGGRRKSKKEVGDEGITRLTQIESEFDFDYWSSKRKNQNPSESVNN